MAKETGEGVGRWSHVRHGKLSLSNSWLNAFKILLTGLIVVTLSGISVAAYAAWGLYQEVDTVELADDGGDAVELGAESIEGELTILLVGSDSREGQSINDGEEGELNDVNLLLHVSADHQNATVMSFPRDMMVPIPSCPGPNGESDYYPAMSEQQLNSAMMYGGLPCVARTLEELTGMDIPYASLITFDGVIAISNAIGGVDVCLAQPIVDPNADLDLPAGENTLVGVDALQFLRTRYGVGNGGDTSRISNQQVFMSSLVRKLKSEETLSNPQKIYQLAKAGVENMTMSKNMANADFMRAVAGTVKDIDLERINFVQYPTFDHPYEQGRLTPDYTTAQALLDVVKSGEAIQVTATGEGVQATEPPPAETEPPVEGEAPAEEAPAEEAPAESTGPVELPPGVTGQSGAQATCSAGRTVF